VALRERMTDFITRFIAIDQTSVVYDQLGIKAKTLGRNIVPANVGLETFGDKSKKAAAGAQTLSSAMGKVVTWGIVTGIVYGTIKALKQQVDAMREVEYEIARIKILTNESQETYDNLRNKVFELASAYGTIATEVVKGIKIWVQQGKSIKESLALAETALIGVNVTGLSNTEIVEDMTAGLLAFNIESDKSISLLDKWVKVADKTAIEMNTIADATKRSAASAALVGLTIDELNGLIAAMGESTRMTGEQIGTSLKTILPKLFTDKAIKTLKDIAGVNVYTDKTRTSYKSMGSILSELSVKWDSFNNKQKTDIMLKAVGVRQGNNFVVMMNHYDKAIEASIASLTSQGWALRANNILMNTQKKGVGVLMAELQLLGKTISDLGAYEILGGFVKGLTETSVAANKLIKIIGQLTDKFIGLKDASVFIVGLGGSIAGAATLLSGHPILAVLSILITIITEIGIAKSQTDKLKQAIDGLNKSFENSKSVQSDIVIIMEQLVKQYKDYLDAIGANEPTEKQTRQIERFKKAIKELQDRYPSIFAKSMFVINEADLQKTIDSLDKLKNILKTAEVTAQIKNAENELEHLGDAATSSYNKAAEAYKKYQESLALPEDKREEYIKNNEKVLSKIFNFFGAKLPIKTGVDDLKVAYELLNAENERTTLEYEKQKQVVEALYRLLFDIGVIAEKTVPTKSSEELSVIAKYWEDIGNSIDDKIINGIENIIDKTGTWADLLKDVGLLIRKELIEGLVKSAGISGMITKSLQNIGLSPITAVSDVTDKTVIQGLGAGKKGAGAGILGSLGSLIAPLMLTMGIMQMTGLSDLFGKGRGHFDVNSADISVDEVNLYAKRVVPIGWFSGSTLIPKTVIHTTLDVNVKGTDNLVRVTADRANKNSRIQEERF